MRLEDACQQYIQFTKHELGASYQTQKGYQSWLRHLLRWMRENGYPEPTVADFSTPVLRRFLYYLGDKHYRPRTIRGVFHPVRGFGEYLVREKLLTENPAKAVTLPKLDAARRQTVSEEEVAQLLLACERQRNPFRVAFSRAVIGVLVYTALRRSELLDLKVGDVDLDERSILVRSGKGSKSRRVFLCEPAVTALREWLAVRPQDARHDWLFAYDRNRRLHHNGLQTLVEEVKAVAGFAGRDNIKPHSLRHACATRLLRNGADLRSIQAFLGHSRLATTSIYLHTQEEQLRSIAELASLTTASVHDGEASVPPATTAEQRPRNGEHRRRLVVRQ